MITLRPVCTRRERQAFVRVARAIYPPASPWVRPLDRIVLGALDTRRNPFYRSGTGQAFVAYREGPPVGRILAHVWPRHHRLHGERVAYFGYFECADDPEAARGLLDAAAEVARAAGCRILRGPFNMTAAQEMGVVTGGFEEPPSIDMVYTPAWYPALLKEAGLRPCFRMRTWGNDAIGDMDPDVLLSPHQRERQAAAGLQVRAIRPRQRRAELEAVRELVNVAFLGNWGFVPITPEEWAWQVDALLPLLDPELVLLAEVRGVPVGVTLTVPDFNRILRRMNGSLLHPAALSLLRRPCTDAATVILFAVRKPYQGLGVSRRLNAELVRALRRGGYRRLTITWIAEENAASRAQAEALGMRSLHDLAMYEREV